jgi:hypothetical protein
VIIACGPEDLAHWKTYLMDFQERVYPAAFEPFGFTLPEAFLVWKLNQMNNNVMDVETAVKELTE